ncbi:unnamed protein product [Psylliodes chrysocephalus]|uniref:BESS domain-containing protein n=1 Tax=Psylliodes chrysocephalus TaxID=3402493 RepID=A0A9P0GAI5_9CUCU|nr:unnamed protein product [Psylliodes chrysocephala]
MRGLQNLRQKLYYQTHYKRSQDDLDLSQDHDETQDRQLVDVNGKSQTQVTPSRSTQFRRNKSDLESKLINYKGSQIKQPSPVIQNQSKETDDLAFFRSLQTSLDTLTPNEKLNFRMDVMQLLTRYTNRKPNQDIPNFPNFTPACQQAQQYPMDLRSSTSDGVCPKVLKCYNEAYSDLSNIEDGHSSESDESALEDENNRNGDETEETTYVTALSFGSFAIQHVHLTELSKTPNELGIPLESCERWRPTLIIGTDEVYPYLSA